jgi:hypothetical protein
MKGTPTPSYAAVLSRRQNRIFKIFRYFSGEWGTLAYYCRRERRTKTLASAPLFLEYQWSTDNLQDGVGVAFELVARAANIK